MGLYANDGRFPLPMAKPLCRHGCGRVGQQAKRGLCHRCFRVPEIRAQYPGKLRYNRKSKAMPQQICRACHRYKMMPQKRGLCFNCYYKLDGTREQYPSEHPWGHYSAQERDFNGRHKLPDKPCPYMPGTPEREAVLRERVLAGVSLHHPEDATCREPRSVPRDGLRKLSVRFRYRQHFGTYAESEA